MEVTGSRPGQQIAVRRAAVRFVVLLGVVSLLADTTYEGARSITGPFLATLGASGTVVGIVAGVGELAGYVVRLVSGRVSERTGRLWDVALSGYAVNLVAVPLLALAGHWPAAATLMMAERVGKGVRVPPRDTMLSHATHEMGRGWGFGLHEAMDQTGAVLGPLLVALVIATRGSYRTGFALLVVPALLALVVLATGRVRYPNPQIFEAVHHAGRAGAAYPKVFWVYLGAAGLFAAGFADFALVAFHFQRSGVFGPGAIALVYALAMGVDAAAALVLGRLFDRVGLLALAGAGLLAAFFAPLVFYGGTALAVAGMALWGIGMGAQESIMRAAVASMVGPDRRAGAYGVFNTGFGLAWFAGSILIGVLYDHSLAGLVAFSMVTQLAALPVLVAIARRLPGASARGRPGGSSSGHGA